MKLRQQPRLRLPQLAMPIYRSRHHLPRCSGSSPQRLFVVAQIGPPPGLVERQQRIWKRHRRGDPLPLAPGEIEQATLINFVNRQTVGHGNGGMGEGEGGEKQCAIYSRSNAPHY